MMKLHAPSYRSPFNGPRFGAGAVLLLVFVAQVAAMLHYPGAGDGGMLRPLDASGTHGECSAEPSVEDAARGCALPAVETHADECDCDCEGTECDDSCCYHPPMVSVISSPSGRTSTPASPFVAPDFPAPLSKNLLPPILPPRA